ncbi:unnamed protein product [Ophioblennius macclurei]
MSGRDPFPSPKLENGFSLSGFRREQTRPFDKPTHLAQMEEPWSRLHDAATLASSRRQSAAPCEPDQRRRRQVPADSLDFQLGSVYDHHKDFFWSKSQMLYQRDTVDRNDDGKGRDGEKEDEGKRRGDIRVWVDPQRSSIYSIK